MVSADNMDLTTIVREYEDYYRLKFGKTAKLVRKATAGDAQVQRQPLPHVKQRPSGIVSGEVHPQTIQLPNIKSIRQRLIISDGSANVGRPRAGPGSGIVEENPDGITIGWPATFLVSSPLVGNTRAIITVFIVGYRFPCRIRSYDAP